VEVLAEHIKCQVASREIRLVGAPVWEDGDRCCVKCDGGAEVLAETSTRLLQETIIMGELGSGQFVRISTRGRGDRCPGLSVVTCGSGIGEPFRGGCTAAGGRRI
jgi:hypothetical protein